MRKLLFVLALLIISALSSGLYAQTKTAYEIKKEAIAVKYLNKIGVSNNEIQRAKNADDSGFLLMLLIAERFELYAMEHGTEALVMITEMEKEMEAAESLKSEEDFRKERLAEEEKERKKLEAQRAYEEQKRQEEEERIKKEKERLYNNSDYVKINNSVENEFKKWMAQDEFETTNAFLSRTKNKTEAFDSICFDVVKEHLQIMRSYPRISIELGRYNADSQLYPIKVSCRPHVMNDTLQMDIEMARKFKDRAEYRSLQLEESFEPHDWMLYNNYLFPKKFFVLEYPHIVRNDTIKSGRILLQTNSMDLKQHFRENHTFDVQRYSEILIAKQRELNREKYNTFLSRAANHETQKQYSNAIKNYKSALRLFPDSLQLNERIDNANHQIVILKRNGLIKEAEDFVSQGAITKAIRKLNEANRVFETDEVKTQISSLEKDLDGAKENHAKLYRIYFDEASKVNGAYQQTDYFIINTIDNIKDGYSDKFRACLTYIAQELNDSWSSIPDDYTEFVKTINREVWGEREQKMYDRILAHQKKAERYKIFNSKIHEATKAEDKKSLKIFKENDPATIVETVINSQN
jgi:hypothetical protein